MKRRNFLAGILPALFAGKAVTEILVQDKPKYVVVHDPCNPKKGEVWEEVGKWSPSGPVHAGCVPDATFEGCIPNTESLEDTSHDPKTGMITYTGPEGFTIRMQYHPWLDGPLPKKYQ